ncbi:MAG: hypothetical protein Q8R31_04010, partial [Candidatus Omnitrophota bacterium]|nr:hypothetical protein [Candidatus Omnitrophota bacterium]
MKKSINNRQYKQGAQSVLEYAVLIACLAGALLAMQIYVKRSIQGRTRDAADEIGEQYSASSTRSRLTQIITNPKDVTITGKPRFIEVEVDGKKEKREIMEIERKEPMVIYMGEGSFETTGKLSDEEL